MIKIIRLGLIVSVLGSFLAQSSSDYFLIDSAYNLKKYNLVFTIADKNYKSFKINVSSNSYYDCWSRYALRSSVDLDNKIITIVKDNSVRPYMICNNPKKMNDEININIPNDKIKPWTYYSIIMPDNFSFNLTKVN